jgi:hypothetical protein
MRNKKELEIMDDVEYKFEHGNGLNESKKSWFKY